MRWSPAIRELLTTPKISMHAMNLITFCKCQLPLTTIDLCLHHNISYQNGLLCVVNVKSASFLIIEDRFIVPNFNLTTVGRVFFFVSFEIYRYHNGINYNLEYTENNCHLN